MAWDCALHRSSRDQPSASPGTKPRRVGTDDLDLCDAWGVLAHTTPTAWCVPAGPPLYPSTTAAAESVSVAVQTMHHLKFRTQMLDEAAPPFMGIRQVLQNRNLNQIAYLAGSTFVFHVQES